MRIRKIKARNRTEGRRQRNRTRIEIRLMGHRYENVYINQLPSFTEFFKEQCKP